MNDYIKCPACMKKRPDESHYQKLIGDWCDMEWSYPRFDQSGNMIPKIEIKPAKLMRCDHGHNFSVRP